MVSHAPSARGLSLALVVLIVCVFGGRESFAQSPTWTGIVRDFSTGEPLPGAVVRLQATHHRTTTDASGRFHLEGAPEGGRLVAGAVGYYYEGVDGERVDELGGIGDPASGYFAGLPGKLFARAHEDAEGRAPVLFTEAVRVRYDTRIPALEMDTSSYRFDLPEGAHAVDVRVRLIYRRAWRALIDEKSWTHDGHDVALADLIGPNFGVVMAEESIAWSPAPEARGRCTSMDGAGISWASAATLLALLALRARARRARAFRSF